MPDLSTNLFFVTASLQKGVATLVHPTNPALESGDVAIPMETYGVDDATAKLMCSIEMN